jgi:hypothetical protein
MDKSEINAILQYEFNTSEDFDFSNIPVTERWLLYEVVRKKIQDMPLTPEQYTQQIIKLSDILEI